LFVTKSELIAWLDNPPTFEDYNRTPNTQSVESKTLLNKPSRNNCTSRTSDNQERENTNHAHKRHLATLEAKYEACLWWRVQPEYSTFSDFLREKFQQSINRLERDIQTIEVQISQSKEASREEETRPEDFS